MQLTPPGSPSIYLSMLLTSSYVANKLVGWLAPCNIGLQFPAFIVSHLSFSCMPFLTPVILISVTSYSHRVWRAVVHSRLTVSDPAVTLCAVPHIETHFVDWKPAYLAEFQLHHKGKPCWMSLCFRETLKWQAVVECPVNGDHFRTFIVWYIFQHVGCSFCRILIFGSYKL